MIVNGVSAINSISRVDLSLNTVWNQNDPNSIYQKVPIHNNTIPTAVDTGTTLYNDLAPYIFIRAMNGDTDQPWTFTSSSIVSPSWTLIIIQILLLVPMNLFQIYLGQHHLVRNFNLNIYTSRR